ncbi:MAG: fused MFS/spermidine synthase [Pseudomonadota bacterium]
MTDTPEHPQPFLVDSRNARALYFSFDSVQSRMRLDDPDALDLAYTRTMMGFLLFVPQPRRISVIGLGGGSLVKFCHRHLPQASLQVAEINPHVLALRDDFMLPPDSARLAMQQLDGARFVRQPQAACEVLLLDGFDRQGMPDALCSQRFFDDAMGALDDGGVLVINLHRADQRLDLIMARLARSFAGDEALLAVDDEDGGNRVVFAWRGRDFRRYRPGLLAGPGQQLAADFAPILAALQQARTPQPGPRPRR